MTRLIDADYTLKQYEEYCKNNCKYTVKQRDVMCRACPTGDAIEMLEDAPTVDAIPRSEIEAAIEEIESLKGDNFPNSYYVKILKKHISTGDEWVDEAVKSGEKSEITSLDPGEYKEIIKEGD